LDVRPVGIAMKNQSGRPSQMSGLGPKDLRSLTHEAHLRCHDLPGRAGANRLLVEEFGFCNDAEVEREQERELRQWAIALSGAAEPERRAMGRAILMLLERVDLLQAELLARSSAPEPNPIVPAVDGAAIREVHAGATPLDDPDLGLRDRLRAATHRGRD
jgi:hypothetical protein